jgi:hypothetical protein
MCHSIPNGASQEVNNHLTELTSGEEKFKSGYKCHNELFSGTYGSTTFFRGAEVDRHARKGPGSLFVSLVYYG